MAYKYCVAENWGLGFFTVEDSLNFKISGFPGNVWQLPANNRDANLWVNKVAGIWKTKEEAQAIVDAIIAQAQADWDAEIAKAQADWDALPEEEKNSKELFKRPRPTAIILE